MRFAGFMLVLIAAGCPEVHAQPALWFSKEDLPRLRATVQQGPEAEVWQHLRERAENFCNPDSRDYADPDAVARRPEREWRVQILGHYFGRRLTDWMETLGFAYQITGDARFAQHGVLLLDAATRQLPVTDPEIAAGFAGARGDIMRGLAIGYDWLGEAMTPEQRAAWAETSAGYVRNMIAEVSRERIWWRPYHNFMGVAMGAAGMLTLSLQEFYPGEASEWTAFCADQIDLWFRSGFDARGAYVEGTSYGIYGLSNALRFADALRRTGGRDLLKHPRLQGVPGFYAMSLLPGESVFDARNNANYSGFGDPTLLLLAGAHQNGLARWLWERAGTGRSPFQIVWANQVQPVEPREAGQPLAQLFEGRGLGIWRTGWESRDVMFSIEAGPYYPVTHNQADEGHFTLYGLGQRWSIDSGYGNTGLAGGRDQTVAHNCVLIDGQGMARSGAGRGTSGRLVEYHDGPQYGYALADATEAYCRNHHDEPGAVVQWARRHALFLRPSDAAPAYAVVLDDIRKDDQVREYTWMMHTPAAMQIRFAEAGGAELLPDSARLVTWLETPEEASGRGSAVWTFSITEPGDYVLWGRARAAGAVAAQSDSFFVQVNDHPRFDWHIPSRRDWTWGRIGAGRRVRAGSLSTGTGRPYPAFLHSRASRPVGTRDDHLRRPRPTSAPSHVTGGHYPAGRRCPRHGAHAIGAARTGDRCAADDSASDGHGATAASGHPVRRPPTHRVSGSRSAAGVRRAVTAPAGRHRRTGDRHATRQAPTEAANPLARSLGSDHLADRAAQAAGSEDYAPASCPWAMSPRSSAGRRAALPC
jgi:hypothetical protein